MADKPKTHTVLPGGRVQVHQPTTEQSAAEPSRSDEQKVLLAAANILTERASKLDTDAGAELYQAAKVLTAAIVDTGPPTEPPEGPEAIKVVVQKPR